MLLAALSGVQEAGATHLVGGYMSYEFLGKNAAGNLRYKISLFVFRDCLNGQVPLEDRIDVGIYHVQTNSLYKVITVPMIGRPQRVQPPGFTRCNFYDNNVCVERGIYETITEVAPSQFGYHLLHVVCCRNVQVNLTNSPDGSPNQGQTYYARIPPTQLENSSPVFRTIPSPFICVDDTTDILYSAVDIDGDSLVYRLMHPYAGGAPTGLMWNPPAQITLPLRAVQYNGGYSSVIPFGTDGYLSVEPRTGLTSLFSRKLGSYVVGIEVLEYRNGEQIGSPIRLDLQILVLQCPPNRKPEISAAQGYEYEVEAGKEICFDILGNDADNDNLLLDGVGQIFDGSNGYKGPRASFSNTSGRGSVSSRFCWTPGCDQVNNLPYLFTIMLTDDGCPSKFDSKNFSIKVNPFKGSDGIDGPDRVCQGGDGYVYTARNPKSGSSFQWEIQNGLILGPDNGSSVRIRWNNSGNGLIRLTEISSAGCPSETVEKWITIDPNPPLPVISGKDTICEAELLVLSSTATLSNQLFWEASGSPVLNISGRNAEIQWSAGVKGDFVIRHWAVNSTGCVSDTAVFRVNVRKPEPSLRGPQSVCPNSRDIIYEATGISTGSALSWSVNGGVHRVTGIGQISVDWGNPGLGSVQLTETDRFGCLSDPETLQVQKEYNLRGEPIEGDTVVCAFEQGVPYQVVRSQGSAYRWQIDGGTQQSGDSSHVISVNWGAAGNARVSYVQAAFDAVNNLWCYSDTIALDLRIYPIPDATEISGPAELCQFEGPFVYTMAGFPGSRYHWRINGDSSNITGQGTASVSIRWDIPGSFVLSVQETSLQDCPGPWIDTVVVVHPKPVTSPISGEQLFCQTPQGTVNYQVQGLTGSSYQWTIRNGSIQGSNNGPSIDVLWNGDNPAWLFVQETSNEGCLGDSIWYSVYFDKLAIDLKAVSVGTPDDRMHIFWEIPEDAVYNGDFIIEGKIQNESVFNPIASVSAPVNYYLQTGINTDLIPWVYRIRAENMCGEAVLSEEHTNVRVDAFRVEGSNDVEVNFSPYMGWDNGVSLYEIYLKSGAETQYRLLQSQSGTMSVLVPDASDQFRQCFRVLAYEEAGKLMSSWSNEVCITFSPNLFVPNAFSPNTDQLNDRFNVQGGAVKTFHISIYDRWGTLLFEGDRMDFNWDGTYMGSEVPGGVYAYQIRYTDYADRLYDRAGTFHLIR